MPKRKHCTSQNRLLLFSGMRNNRKSDCFILRDSPFVTQYPDNKRGVPCQGGALEKMVGLRLEWRSGSAAARRLPKPPPLNFFFVSLYNFFRTWFAVSFQNACVGTFIRSRDLQPVSFFIHVSICTIYWTVSIAPPLCQAVFGFLTTRPPGILLFLSRPVFFPAA